MSSSSGKKEEKVDKKKVEKVCYDCVSKIEAMAQAMREDPSRMPVVVEMSNGDKLYVAVPDRESLGGLIAAIEEKTGEENFLIVVQQQ